MKKILLMLMLLCNIANGGTIRPEVSDEKYLEAGREHESVIKLFGRYNKSNKNINASGSAVVIDENWILTAAHVVSCMEHPFFHLKEKKYNIDKVIINPEFNSKPTEGGDLALCHVKEKIIIKKYPKLYSKKDESGKICKITGYGITGTGETGARVDDNKKRSGTNRIDVVSEKLLFCNMSKENPTALEFLIAHGDSGGGLFINEELAGIHSFVSTSDGNANSDYGDESGHTRISKYKGWIEENINK